MSAVAGLAVLLIGAAAAPAGSESRAQVVAIIDGHAITQQELDTRIAVALYQLRQQGLEQLIDDYLLEQAAKRAHTSIPEYLDKETAVTVTDADARAQYDKYNGLMKLPFDQLKPRLIAALTSQRKAQRQAELSAKLHSDAHVDIKLEQPRIEVAVANSPSIGPANAPVTIVEFGDYQSPFNPKVQGALQQTREKYGDQLRLVFKDFPQLTSKDGMVAAEAARCAGEQGKFWQFQDALYDDQTKLAVPDLKAHAQQLGLDSQKFNSCLDSGKYSGAIEKDIEDGMRIGIRGAPTFIINGNLRVGIQSAAGFAASIDPELKGKGRIETKLH
jgi:protein-disulfide isomerase